MRVPSRSWLLGLIVGLTLGAVLGAATVSRGTAGRGEAVLARLAEHLVIVDGPLNGVAGPHVIFEGINLHLRSGSGSTDDGTFAGGDIPQTGLGNLIIGYNAAPFDLGEGERRASHTLVIGNGHRYSSWAGLVAGGSNTITGAASSVTGGAFNTASGETSSVTGGNSNRASGRTATVSGGSDNVASGQSATVSGGAAGTASGTMTGSPARWARITRAHGPAHLLSSSGTADRAGRDPARPPGPRGRCADCGQPIATCTSETDLVPPEPLPYRGHTIEVDARLAGNGWWAPVLTIRWTRQDAGREEAWEIPNIPPELFGTADEARAKALWYGKAWVDRRA